MKASFLNLERGERVTDVVNHRLVEMPLDGSCDHCGKELPRDTRVLGKVVKTQKGIVLSSRFSPTCLQCANMN